MVALAIITANSFAQVQSDIQSATLIHGDQTSVYYGASAFSNAYSAAAEEGDVIVLSAGTFNTASDITKSISVYGAGYETDAATGAEPTVINYIQIKSKTITDEEGNQINVYPKVLLEGLHLSSNNTQIMSLWIQTSDATLENLVVRKCKMHYVGNCAKTKNCLFTNCVITQGIGAFTSPNHNGYRFTNYFLGQQEQLNFENCWIGKACGYNLDATINYDHCIIKDFTNRDTYAHYTNNIIYHTLPDNCTAYNNIFIGSGMGAYIVGENNWTGMTNDAIWSETDEDGSYGATKTFALRFPAKYVGTDGTEVGINGGHAPFDRISPIPRILAADVDLRTAEDGKLNVSFKVEAQTKE